VLHLPRQNSVRSSSPCAYVQPSLCRLPPSNGQGLSLGPLNMRAREGDFVETSDGLFFDVKGLLHPPDRIVAYLRYYPDNRGTRLRDDVRYAKIYNLSGRRSLLKRKWPEYLYYDEVQGRELQGVPRNKIRNLYNPPKKPMAFLRSRQRDPLETNAIRLIQVLSHESRLPSASFGISGSLLVGLHRPGSDIDVVAYGAEESKRVHSAILSLLNNDQCFRRYSARDLRRLYMRRGLQRAIGFRDFVGQERRKVFEGKFMGHDYFLRCVKRWREITERYGDVRYSPMGRCMVSGWVSDDAESLLTPCTYSLERVRVLEGARSRRPSEVVSFRGRFAEQAGSGERIVARGRVESVQSDRSQHFRLVVGESIRDVLKRIE